jgi:DNA-binding NarL/FixJ family response regulator
MRFFRTLIVEDNPLFRQTIVEILRNQFPSMILEEAGDGKTALQKIEEEVPDLIFMDIKLPGENGLHLTEHIKKKYPHVPVVILTSYDWPEYREAAFKIGANYFMMKGSSTNREIVELIESIFTQLGFTPDGVKNNGGSPKGNQNS